jgi:hypothetical protein
MVRMMGFSGFKTKLSFLFDPQSRGGIESLQDMRTLMNQGQVELSQEGDQADEGAQAYLTCA